MSSAALQAVKKFRIQEFKNLKPHLARFEALPQYTKVQDDKTVAVLPNPFLPRRNPTTGKWAPPKYSLRRQADLVKAAKASGTLQYLPAGPKSRHEPLFSSAPAAPAETPVEQQEGEVDAETAPSSLAPTSVKPALTPRSHAYKVLRSGPVREAVESLRTAAEAANGEGWKLDVTWHGVAAPKKNADVAGGARLYAMKKRMFKGHKWERVRGKVERKRKIVLRDMAKRIYNYKMHYKRRRPDPLKPARSAKAPKLPF